MNAERRAMIALKVKEAFEKHPGVERIPGPTLASMVVQSLKFSVEKWSATCTDVVEYIEEEIKAGNLTRTRGPKGGVGRSPTFWAATKATQDAAINPVVAAINDHTCPGCGNDRCSKSERTCWKCGGSLH